jgi:hypothetical protein
MFRIGRRLAHHLTVAIHRAWWEFWFDLWAFVDNEHNVKYGHVDADAGDATDTPMRDFGGVCADSGGGE